MKKYAVLLLTALYVVAFTEVKELLKVPALVVHFSGHEKEDKQTGLLALLALHYGNPVHSDNDDEQDEQLPFKNTENDLVFSPSVTPEHTSVSFILPIKVSGLLTFKSCLQQSHLNDFWQPPKQFFAA